MSDENDLLRDAVRQAVELIAAERDRYREALVLIASHESGHWGVIAHEALWARSSRAEALQATNPPPTQGDP